MKKLNGLEMSKRYIAHIGCIESCLGYLGVKISTPWIYGGTGHAFINNIPEDLCPSGPTAWNTDMLFQLAPNLGYKVEGIKVSKEDAGENFSEKQKEVWDMVRASINQSLPCYGFQLNSPDFYVINGYDDTGYFYLRNPLYYGSCEGHLEWQKLGTCDVEVLEVYSVKTCDPAPIEKAVKDAFIMVLKHGKSKKRLAGDKWVTGLDGLLVWANALEAGNAMIDGNAYNTICWHECREMAVEFLKEAKIRLDGKCNNIFGEAIEYYTISRDSLKRLKEICPERENADWKTKFASREGAALVREVYEAENKGLGCLKQISTRL
ncbi:hypothetical protein FJZ31_28140 [Candidatus Poribacteria bacterium]|nr:hypothetical protein [Candidatus Poribacteria bacterium]